ncbi:MAG TPA: ABC transporter ATP-binding protein [bacterium]|nr:ABC transporter ATP-binding protein [bacterium]
MHSSALKTSGLRREYRMSGDASVVALDGLDIEVRRGEFVAITGPSGCGKTTLLNLLGGLDQPSEGSVQVDGTDLAGHDETWLAALRRKKIGFIFQRHDLFSVLTARENVEFPLLLEGVAQEARGRLAQNLLTLVGLTDIGERLPEEMSGGQQQRVGIARALANEPEILLADEPTGNLDAATSDEIMAVLIELKQRLGLTLVIVTHDPAVAALADRRIRLRDGRIADEAERASVKGNQS